MGLLCDQADMDRFMRTKEGQEVLSKFRKRLLRHTIEDVEFVRLSSHIAAHLTLDNGDVVQLLPPFLEVDTIRNQYPKLLDREYYKDYPDRKPKTKKGTTNHEHVNDSK